MAGLRAGQHAFLNAGGKQQQKKVKRKIKRNKKKYKQAVHQSPGCFSFFFFSPRQNLSFLVHEQGGRRLRAGEPPHTGLAKKFL